MASPTTSRFPAATPAWASALGVVAIVLGVFFTAYQVNEWMTQTVLTGAMPESGIMPPAVCPEEELEEEGLSLAECEYMVEHVKGLVLSTPDWFPGLQKWLTGLAAALGFASILVGAALVNYRSWAPVASLGVFAGLVALDVLQFAAVVNAGPILRYVYLWSILLWILLHLMLVAAAAAGHFGISTNTVESREG